MQERLTRVPFTRPIYVSAEGAWSRPKRLLASNVSHGGMYVRSDAGLEPGTRVGVSLEAKGKIFPFAEAEVIWSADKDHAKKDLPGFGLRFVRFLHPRSENLIDHVLNRGTPLPPEVGNQLVGAPEAEPRPALPPMDFAQTPIRDDAPAAEPGEPAWSAAALAAEETPLPPQGSALEEDHGRIATAIGLVAVLVITGGVMLYLVQRNAARAAPEPVAVEVAAPAVEAPVALEPAVVAPAPAPVEVRSPAPVVEAPVAPPQPKPAPVVKASPPARSVSLSSGAASAVQWKQQDAAIELSLQLTEGARIDRVFALSNPSRVVIDLDGAKPRASEKKAVDGPALEMIRTGAREGGTRIVVDLNRAVARVDATSKGASIQLR